MLMLTALFIIHFELQLSTPVLLEKEGLVFEKGTALKTSP